MIIEEFLEKHNGSPIDEEELAELIANGVDDPEMENLALDYIEALQNFRLMLDKIGYE